MSLFSSKFVKQSLLALSSLSIVLATLANQPAHAGSPVSLFSTTCLTTSVWNSSIDSFIQATGNVTIGDEVYTFVGAIRSGYEFMGSPHIRSGTPAGVACRITPSNSKPRFQTLNLKFGFSNNNSNTTNTSRAKLTVLIDGNSSNCQKEIGKGELLSCLVNITNVKSIALKGECLSDGNCPAIVFTEASLIPLPISPGRRN